MNLIRLNATEMPVPALDIDLFWHTHQLTPSNYLPWCNHHIGRPINREFTHFSRTSFQFGIDCLIHDTNF